MNSGNLLVSICCLAYNHELYIQECLDGFMMQKTNFKFEILIHDDASTDRTAEIIKIYEEKYPEILKPIYQTENQFSKKIGSITSAFNFPRVKGKYIAICEGDDYWTDPYKLQKQVDFLESNPDYGLVHTDCDYFIHHKNIFERNANRNLLNNYKLSSGKELFDLLISGNYKVRTATVLFREELLDVISTNRPKFLMGDTPMWLDFSQNTKFKYFDEVTTVYRVLVNSASRSPSLIRNLRFSLSMAEMRLFYVKKYGFEIGISLKERYNNALLEYKYVDKSFKELFPLIQPTKIQSFKMSHVDNKYFHRLFSFQFKTKRFSQYLLHFISK
jgi:glycosyltransferase involved in cell wall biosynthesis